ncbi:M23 family metallopeptidase [Romboutsia sp. 13368]|uniref:M23 family metallopeptidase n=1 Tax=Romboutsia sp. 13368 TaxID=2708053 RepID=UPI0025FD4F7B|nr:M23 family metallopeptidase [Romboutsia sp. 13368]
MNKNIKFIIIFITLALGIFIYQVKDFTIHAVEVENKIDLLIENKENQRKLNLEINELDNKISSLYKEENNTYNKVEVVTVSFIDNTTFSKKNITNLNIESLISEKYELEEELDKYIDEYTKLEKQIESEKLEELRLKNIEYTNGIWPIKSYNEISSPFGERIHPISGKLSFHKGIDIPAPQDTDILACDDGIVLFSGIMNGYGNVIKLKHFDGKITLYAHNNSNLVEEGDIIKTGQVIAKVGTTGNSTGNHLHFETIVNEENINPIEIIK